MARILRQTTVIRDGQHNAFTDLVYWQNCYWVGYRKGAAHVSLESEAVVAVSSDRQRFREVAHLRVPGDNRDPKFVVIDDDHLAIIFPTWIGGHAKRQLQQYIAFTTDGFTWTRPQPILDRQYWLWRVRQHDGLFYGMAKHIVQDNRFVALETSTDLLTWKRHCTIAGEHTGHDEPDIVWRPDGEAWMVLRNGSGNGTSWFAKAKAPYTDWQTNDLGVLIHAPVMLQHQGEVYVAGRRHTDKEGDTTWPYLGWASLGLWRITDGAVEPVLRIPATGDCSYPGLIVDPEGRICMSYYSQHAYHSGVLDFCFRLEPDAPHDKAQLLTPNDIYFAELELP